MWVDFDGDGNKDTSAPSKYDQVTLYTYGVTKGASVPDSKIASNRLLKKTTYPPQYTSGGGQPAADREVEHAYNAQGQAIYTEDQEGNVIQQNYDTLGRLTQRRLTSSPVAGFDYTVKRIAMTYLPRSLADKVKRPDRQDLRHMRGAWVVE